MNVWDQVKKALEHRVCSESYQNWVASSSLSREDLETLVVLVPSQAAKEWLEEEYSALVKSTLQDLRIPTRTIIYEVVNSQRALEDPVAATASRNDDIPLFHAAAQLNPKFTFDTFVVGSCNQLAHAAAKAVATLPSKSYNPLFIYGGSGMGKTHLMHAIGRALMENFSGMRIAYTSSERFMNEMINCIRFDRMPQFHQYFRSADVLLVDDIHILAHKERTQEEFFHTFNELYDHQKQIVISSDSSPKEIPGLVGRLRSRFEWGLMADIQPPDLETKMAILDKKAAMEGVPLPEDVRIFLAAKTKSNIRELEGALVKLIAYSSLTGSDINLTMAQQTLKHLTVTHDRKISMDTIIRTVADKYGLQPSQLKQKSNARTITKPRQVAMYLIKEYTSASLPEIGRAFAGKHHTTVMHAIRKIERDRQRDPDLNRIIHNLIDSFN